MALRTLGLALSRMSLAPALPRGVPALRAPTFTPVQTRLPPAAARAASTTCGVSSSWTFTSFAARTPPSPSSSSSSCLVGKTLAVQARQLATSQPTKASLRQMHKTGPVRKKRKNKNPLGKKAFARGVVLKTLIKKPRKPNSANRKCVLVRLSTGREMVAYVPGEGHNLQEHNIVLVRPGRLQDVPGVKVRCIRGKYDLQHVIKKKA